MDDAAHTTMTVTAAAVAADDDDHTVAAREGNERVTSCLVGFCFQAVFLKSLLCIILLL